MKQHDTKSKQIMDFLLSYKSKILISWKIQEQKFFARHCLSKRQQRNEEVVRFIVKIFLEIKSWSVEEVKETVLDSSFSKASFAGKTILAKVDNVQKCTQRYYLHLIDCCNTRC